MSRYISLASPFKCGNCTSKKSNNIPKFVKIKPSALVFKGRIFSPAFLNNINIKDV